MGAIVFHQSRVGDVQVEWNFEGKITRVSLPVRGTRSAYTPACRPADEPPFVLRPVLDGLSRFLTSGESMEPLNWALIESSELSDFQRAVYQVVQMIPAGQTRTYGWVACRCGRPLAVRAVGQALRKNPLPILIPCHRVVAATALGGFMGASKPGDAELELKKSLIDLEQEFISPVFSFLAAPQWLGATG